MVINKQTIMERLLNGYELTKDELIFVSRNLDGGVEATNFVYQHNDNDCMKACGYGMEDIAALNKEFQVLVQSNKLERVSELVEGLEGLCLKNPKFARIVYQQAVKVSANGPIGLGGASGLPDIGKAIIRGTGLPSEGLDITDEIKKLFERLRDERPDEDEDGAK